MSVSKVIWIAAVVYNWCDLTQTSKQDFLSLDNTRVHFSSAAWTIKVKRKYVLNSFNSKVQYNLHMMKYLVFHVFLFLLFWSNFCLIFYIKKMCCCCFLLGFYCMFSFLYFSVLPKKRRLCSAKWVHEH